MMKRCEVFNRTALLTGTARLEEFEKKKVIIFGVGGVGSWTAETLVRTGFTNITLVDADRVAVSNINRQLPATALTVGEIKVDAMRRHLLEINPEANITAIHGYYTAETAHEYNLENYDFIVDAIDSLTDKALLILRATDAMAATSKSEHPVKFFSSMGAALKLDPSRISVAEFWKVKGCPLAAALRRKFKKSETFPKKKFMCVYSDELIKNHEDAAMLCDNSGAMRFNKVSVNGSMMHITSIFGIRLASLIIKDFFHY